VSRGFLFTSLLLPNLTKEIPQKKKPGTAMIEYLRTIYSSKPVRHHKTQDTNQGGQRVSTATKDITVKKTHLTP
jgi:hypothetical protein